MSENSYMTSSLSTMDSAKLPDSIAIEKEPHDHEIYKLENGEKVIGDRTSAFSTRSPVPSVRPYQRYSYGKGHCKETKRRNLVPKFVS